MLLVKAAKLLRPRWKQWSKRLLRYAGDTWSVLDVALGLVTNLGEDFRPISIARRGAWIRRVGLVLSGGGAVNQADWCVGVIVRDLEGLGLLLHAFSYSRFDPKPVTRKLPPVVRRAR
ncbi:hypothetical protein [Haloferula sp. A504]|uniref:hypothetical protein n=1 Tax=Haloferula sp. A504 TaxID=3373601 RepID=UPI0031C1B7D0|nr:hypothetical protein [Verrucomicrobiaceae bacterium E54]